MISLVDNYKPCKFSIILYNDERLLADSANLIVIFAHIHMCNQFREFYVCVLLRRDRGCQFAFKKIIIALPYLKTRITYRES